MLLDDCPCEMLSFVQIPALLIHQGSPSLPGRLGWYISGLQWGWFIHSLGKEFIEALLAPSVSLFLQSTHTLQTILCQKELPLHGANAARDARRIQKWLSQTNKVSTGCQKGTEMHHVEHARHFYAPFNLSQKEGRHWNCEECKPSDCLSEDRQQETCWQGHRGEELRCAHTHPSACRGNETVTLASRTLAVQQRSAMMAPNEGGHLHPSHLNSSHCS